MALGCCEKTVLRMVQKGRLGAKRGPHGAYMFDPAEVGQLPARKRGRPAALPDDEAFEQLLGPALDQDGELGKHLRRTIANPSYDPTLFRYLKFHRLQLQGRSWREAMAEIGADEYVLQFFPPLDRLDEVLYAQVEQRKQLGRSAVPPAILPRRPGPPPLEPPALSPEEEMRSWQLLAEDEDADHDEDTLTVLEMIVAGTRFDISNIVHAHRLERLGYGATQIGLYLRVNRRWVYRLLERDFCEELRISLRKKRSERDRELELDRRRQARRDVRAFRGFGDELDENYMPPEPGVESLDARLERAEQSRWRYEDPYTGELLEELVESDEALDALWGEEF